MANPLSSNIWYFGSLAGLNFNSININGDPNFLTNGPINTFQGCSVISDASGNYVFCTDGINVYNASRTNIGVTLGGSNFSTSAGVIIAKPSDPGKYYIFTTPTQDSGLRGPATYSVYDSVTQLIVPGTLNTVLFGGTNQAEKICVITNPSTGIKYIIFHDVVGFNYNVLKVDNTGISLNQTFIGFVNYGSINGHANLAQGYMKCNNNGYVVDCQLGGPGTPNGGGVRLLNFDPSTGLLSNDQALITTSKRWYSCDFSSDGLILYVSTVQEQVYGEGNDILLQFDLTSNVLATIQASQFTVATATGGENFGALQLGPNNRMYYGVIGSTLISVIKNPEIIGTGCNYSHLSVSLGTFQCELGLPTFDAAAVVPSPSDPCASFLPPTITKVGTTLSVPTGASTYQWAIDGVNVPGATFNTFTPTVTGSHVVTVTNNIQCVKSSDPFLVVMGCTNPNAINYNVAANFDDGTCIVCAGIPPPEITLNNGTLFVPNTYTSYQWSKLNPSQQLNVGSIIKDSTMYHVDGVVGGNVTPSLVLSKSGTGNSIRFDGVNVDNSVVNFGDHFYNIDNSCLVVEFDMYIEDASISGAILTKKGINHLGYQFEYSAGTIGMLIGSATQLLSVSASLDDHGNPYIANVTYRLAFVMNLISLSIGIYCNGIRVALRDISAFGHVFNSEGGDVLLGSPILNNLYIKGQIDNLRFSNRVINPITSSGYTLDSIPYQLNSNTLGYYTFDSVTNISGQDTSSFTPLSSGIYCVTTVNANGCSATSCTNIEFGCQDALANNFDPTANIGDGSCLYDPCKQAAIKAMCCTVGCLYAELNKIYLGTHNDKDFIPLLLNFYLSKYLIDTDCVNCIDSAGNQKIISFLGSACGCNCGGNIKDKILPIPSPIIEDDQVISEDEKQIVSE